MLFHTPLPLRALVLLMPAALLSLLAGCGADPAGQAAATSAPSEQPFVRIFSPPKQSGAELWASNCNRCHNAPPPTDFSGGEWDLIMHHMRLRANLTGEEARTVAEFLKAAN